MLSTVNLFFFWPKLREQSVFINSGSLLQTVSAPSDLSVDGGGLWHRNKHTQSWEWCSSYKARVWYQNIIVEPHNYRDRNCNNTYGWLQSLLSRPDIGIMRQIAIPSSSLASVLLSKHMGGKQIFIEKWFNNTLHCESIHIGPNLRE